MSEREVAAVGSAPWVPAELLRSASTERILGAEEVSRGALLAVDTALGTSVALGVNGRVYEAVSDDPKRHAEVIGVLLVRVLEMADVPSSAVTGVVTGVGPGPFTGLRVGIAAAHAFATGRGVPVLPLQGAEAVALAVLSRGAAAGARVMQDARRRELFVTEYERLDWAGVPVRSVAAHLVTRAEYEPAAHDIWPERVPAARLVQLAARRFATGRAFEADRALYLRAPDVRQPGAPKRVIAAHRSGRGSGTERRADSSASASPMLPPVPTGPGLSAPSDPSPDVAGGCSLRKASTVDLDALWAIETAVFGATAWSRDVLREELSADHRHYLALVEHAADGGETVRGYAGLLVLGTEGDIQTIAVAPEARGAGHGRELMRALLEEAETRGVREMFLEVRADNPVARGLYETLGFAKIDVRPRYYQPEGVDAIVMRLRLSRRSSAPVASSRARNEEQP